MIALDCRSTICEHAGCRSILVTLSLLLEAMALSEEVPARPAADTLHFRASEPHEDHAEREGLACKCLISLGLGLLPSSDWVPSDLF